MSEVKNRYEAIDGLKAFACFGIVAMHVRVNTHYQLDGFFFNEFIFSLTNLVFLFMTISAFGMCCGYYNKVVDKKLDVNNFYKKRYIKILPFFAALCLMDFVVSPSLNSFYEVFANCTLCFGLIPNASFSVIGVGWFIGVVFIFYLMFPFFCYLLSNKKRAWIATIAAYFMNYLCRHYFNVNRQSMAYSFVFFMFGGLVFLYKDKVLNKPWARWISVFGFGLFVLIYFCTGGSVFAIILINVFLLLYALFINGKGLLNNRVTKAVGSISFEVYLSHMFIFRIFEKAHLLSIVENEYMNYIFIVILVFVGACIFAIILKKIIDAGMKAIIGRINEL